jgi:hypothetical protein
LASGVGDGNILFWDIPGKTSEADSAIGDGRQIVDKLAKNLAADGKLAHQAIWGLVARPVEAVPIRRERALVRQPQPAVQRHPAHEL